MATPTAASASSTCWRRARSRPTTPPSCSPRSAASRRPAPPRAPSRARNGAVLRVSIDAHDDEEPARSAPRSGSTSRSAWPSSRAASCRPRRSASSRVAGHRPRRPARQPRRRGARGAARRHRRRRRGAGRKKAKILIEVVVMTLPNWGGPALLGASGTTSVRASCWCGSRSDAPKPPVGRAAVAVRGDAPLRAAGPALARLRLAAAPRLVARAAPRVPLRRPASSIEPAGAAPWPALEALLDGHGEGLLRLPRASPSSRSSPATARTPSASRSRRSSACARGDMTMAPHPMPTACPVTGEPLEVTRLQAPGSGVAIEGRFRPTSSPCSPRARRVPAPVRQGAGQPQGGRARHGGQLPHRAPALRAPAARPRATRAARTPDDARGDVLSLLERGEIDPAEAAGASRASSGADAPRPILARRRRRATGVESPPLRAGRRSVECTITDRASGPYTVARARPLRHPRRRPRRGRRHHQERVPQARAALPPDRNNGDAEAEERFKAINEAYAVLSDPEKRARFDRYGDADAQAAFSGDIFDVFASVFGGGMGGRRGPRQRGMPGEDLEVEIEVTLEQARDGSTMQVEVERFTACDHCHGERSEPGGEGSAAATPAPAPARCGRRRSRSSVPSSPPRRAPAAAAWARSSSRPARCAAAPVGRPETAWSTCRSPRGSTAATACASRARATSASTADRPATSTSTSSWRRTSTCSATATTCAASCASATPRPPSAAASRYPRSTGPS
jgi:hypothetical protein